MTTCNQHQHQHQHRQLDREAAWLENRGDYADAAGLWQHVSRRVTRTS
ncbi:hypothetical protein [Klebsiella aerogenes]|nr:hypothetical protein [Klebsiella aerogenes]